MRARAALLLLLAPAAAPGYVRTTTQSSSPPCSNPEVLPLAWWERTLPFIADDAGTPDVSGGGAFSAVDTSFHSWEVACTAMRLRNDGLRADAPAGYDHLNVVKWIGSGWAQSSRAIAVTLVTFECNTGRLLDADILLNGEAFTFTVTPDAGLPMADVQNTLTHEAGHVLGFDHNPDPESTMYADAPLGETKKRDLTADDIQGMCDVYPDDGGGAGPPPDAGSPDASAAGPDAGVADAGAPPPARDQGGCGGGSPGAVLGLLAALLARRMARLTAGHAQKRSRQGAFGD